MPASMGWHPWFRRRLDGLDGQVELSFEPGRMYERDEEGIATGRLIAPTPPPWDDCFADLAADPRLHLARRPGADDLVVVRRLGRVTTSATTRCGGASTAPPDAPNLGPTAVEPGSRSWRRWTGAGADASALLGSLPGGCRGRLRGARRDEGAGAGNERRPGSFRGLRVSAALSGFLIDAVDGDERVVRGDRLDGWQSLVMRLLLVSD